MTFKDWTQSMWDKIKARNPFYQEEMESNMANGGFSGYKPNTAKHRAMRETTQQEAVPQQDPMMAGMNWDPQPQEPAYGGYTSQVQPQQPVFQQATGYQQAAAWPNQGTYQQPMGGYTMNQQTPWPQEPQWPDQNMNAFQPQQGAAGYMNWQVPPQPTQPAQPAPVQDNISYMPGNFVGEDGKAYSHCERIAVVANVSMCYRVVEFMRNNESVIVNTEQITDEAENQRCLDLLYGAAFAMKCSFTRVAGKSIYLVAPNTVMVVPYKAIRHISDQDIQSRWPEQEREDRRDRYARADRYAARDDRYDRRDAYGRQDYNPYGGYRQASGYGR